MNTMSPIKTGIIGFGIAGKVFHAPFVGTMEQFELVKISTGNKISQDYIREQYPAVIITSNHKEIINDPNIELVIIGTPNEYHFTYAKEALVAGKHVIVEKPFTITSEEASELIEIGKRCGKILTVHQNRRYDSDFLTLKKLLDSKLLGNVVEYEAHFDRYRPQLKDHAWREEAIPGAGILYDLGAHLIDQALILFGLPEYVYAEINVQREFAKADDQFELILTYKKLKVTLKAGMLVKDPGPHLVLNGDKGSFVKWGMDVQEAALKAGFNPSTLKEWGVEPQELWGKLTANYEGVEICGTVKSETGIYQQYFIDVYDCIKNEGSLKVKAEEARNTIKIIEHAFESNKEMRKIPFK